MIVHVKRAKAFHRQMSRFGWAGGRCPKADVNGDRDGDMVMRRAVPFCGSSVATPIFGVPLIRRINRSSRRATFVRRNGEELFVVAITGSIRN